MISKFALLTCLCLSLSACFGGRSAEPQFYTLTPITAQPLSQKSVSIGVNRVEVARYLDRPQIVTGNPDSTEMTLSEKHRWIEPFPDLVARAFVSDLESLYPNASVKIRSLGQDDFDYTITLEIETFDTQFGKKSKLNAWWTVQDKSGKQLMRRQFTKALPVGKSYRDLAKTQSVLLSDLAKKITTALE